MSSSHMTCNPELRWAWSKMYEHHIKVNSRMMTSSNGDIFRVTGHLCGEFTGPGEFPAQRPVTRSFDACFGLGLNKRLSKQSRGWWYETPSRSLWLHRNGMRLWMSKQRFCYVKMIKFNQSLLKVYRISTGMSPVTPLLLKTDPC